jgi:predicted aconitase
MSNVEKLKIRLSREEKDILRGRRGATLQKIMKTVVFYGEVLGAKRLVEITGKGHFVITCAIPGISPSMKMLDEIITADLKTRYPFTLDPVAPLDFENWWLNSKQIRTLEKMYQNQPLYDEKMKQLGLWAPEACTCTPYLPEIDNAPVRGDILAWSESACVIFVNSVLGARSNRNGAILDLLCNIVGKVPLFGLLTNRGRKATWRIDVKTDTLPPPQILGAAIGTKVLSDVPYIIGLDRFLGKGLNPFTHDYLHEMGAACATAGAVGLFHVENVTPEAVDEKTRLLTPDCKPYTIDESVLLELRRSYPVMWEDTHKKPEKCFLGCPHLSLNQLQWWADTIEKQLKTMCGSHLKVKTTICSAPNVLERFRKISTGWQTLTRAGVKFSPGCPMQLFDNDLLKGEAIITNSNKLRAYTHARFFTDEEIGEILATGKIEKVK